MNNTFRIMIATDNHLGYQEKDNIRKHDSFIALEEVFSEALTRNSDFLLLGGDLFHDHNPSKYTLNRTLQMFNNYVIGDSHAEFDTITKDKIFNYMNSFVKIKLPVFIIHGNHDDPSTDTNISAIELMQSSHYLNYITCENRDEKIYVKPVVLRKNDTFIAIYGIGNIKEERLSRLFKLNLVIFQEPEIEAKVFNILVVHQNRFKGHGMGAAARNCIMDSVFPKFIDVIIWGHEHDSFIEPRTIENKICYIYQPGSTVSTSLTEGEARQKHMFLLEIKHTGFKMTPIPIRNSRKICFQQINLQSLAIKSEDVENLIIKIFEEMIEESNNSIQQLKPPLVRIKVEVTGYENFRAFYLNSKLSEKAANKDIIAV